MKLYIALVVREWTSLSTDTKMVEIIDNSLGRGFCSVFLTRDDALLAGYTNEQILEVEAEDD